MSGFMLMNETYERIELSERDYENLLARFASKLFPRWHMFRWDPLVEGPEGRGKPDQILIRDDFEEWYVVEVELASHPEAHFRDQFRVLASARYGEKVIDSVIAAASGLPEQSLRQVLRRQPSFLCIADDHTETIRLACREHAFELSVLQPYRGDLGNFALWRVRIPESLKRPSVHAGSYTLTLKTRLGGHLVAHLPPKFPVIGEFTVRMGDVLHDCSVKKRPSGKRFALLPVELNDDRKSITLELVDPAKFLFQMVPRKRR